MPRKGEKMNWKVDFAYPGHSEHRTAKSSFSSAELLAGETAQRGARVVVKYAPRGGEPVEVMRIEPGGGHTLAWGPVPPDDEPGFVCLCGRRTRERDRAASHLYAFGLCNYCAGECAVAAVAGGRVECPVCQGSGLYADASYHGVDLALYRSRLEELAAAPLGG